MKALNQMKVAGIAFVGLAVVTIVGIAILTQFKTSASINNATADAWIAAITVFGSFGSIVSLGIVGKALIDMFSGKGD